VSLLVLALSVALAAVTPESAPRLGLEVVVLVAEGDQPRAGETVRAVHRPGLHSETEVAIGITDSRGRVRWTPERAGLAELRAGTDSRRVLVASRAPMGAQVMLVLLFLASFAATMLGLRVREWGRG
jgi:hypothetical protein